MGSKVEIENYRPIAKFCSTSKISEKLIFKQIHYLESIKKIDLTGKNQHGFKCNKSTATAGALLQSIIARAANENNYVIFRIVKIEDHTYKISIALFLKCAKLCFEIINDKTKLKLTTAHVLSSS